MIEILISNLYCSKAFRKLIEMHKAFKFFSLARHIIVNRTEKQNLGIGMQMNTASTLFCLRIYVH